MLEISNYLMHKSGLLWCSFHDEIDNRLLM